MLCWFDKINQAPSSCASQTEPQTYATRAFLDLSGDRSCTEITIVFTVVFTVLTNDKMGHSLRYKVSVTEITMNCSTKHLSQPGDHYFSHV